VDGWMGGWVGGEKKNRKPLEKKTHAKDEEWAKLLLLIVVVVVVVLALCFFCSIGSQPSKRFSFFHFFF